MRIALGVVAGENAVDIVLTGAAAHLLDEDTDDLVDGDDVAKFRAALTRLGIPFHVEAASVPEEAGWNAEGHRVVPIGAEGISALATRASRFIVFRCRPSFICSPATHLRSPDRSSPPIAETRTPGSPSCCSKAPRRPACRLTSRCDGFATAISTTPRSST